MSWAARRIADPVSGLAIADSVNEKDAVEGVKKGPVSKEQPAEVQPVAAGPTKVGENCPKLDDVTCADNRTEIAIAANKVIAVIDVNVLDFMGCLLFGVCGQGAKRGRFSRTNTE